MFMINIVLLIVFFIGGIGLGIGYCALVIRKYPDNRKKLGFAGAITIFFLFSLIFYVLISVNSGVTTIIKDISNEQIQSISKKFPNNAFVKNGLDLSLINNDPSKLNSAVNDISRMLPSANELNLPGFLYDMGINYVKGVLRKIVLVQSSVNNTTSKFSENNILSVSSVINGITLQVIKIVNIIFLVIGIIFLFIFMLYIIGTIKVVRAYAKESDNTQT